MSRYGTLAARLALDAKKRPDAGVSGPVEAACRTDVARRGKQAGMHWRLLNAAAICALSARFRSRLPAA